MAVEGLHAVNYNAYMLQAKDYAEEIKKIDADIANDPGNTALIDRRYALIEAQREMIRAAEDEKEAIRDLVSEGYDAMIDALQAIIDKRKDMLQSIKDTYDYEKTINEQTKTIASYQKQLQAYGGDDSEETRAKIQQIKVSAIASIWKAENYQVIQKMVLKQNFRDLM